MPLLARHAHLSPDQLYAMSQEALRSLMHDKGPLVMVMVVPHECELALGSFAWLSHLWPDVMIPQKRGAR